MKSIAEIFKYLKPILVSYHGVSDFQLEIKDVTNNSNEVYSGILFVAISGNTIDSHQFLPQVINAGAKAVVVSESYSETFPDIPMFKVKDCYHAWAILVDLFFDSPSKDMVFHTITGTNGKTSTAYFLRHILNFDIRRKTGLFSTISIHNGDDERVSNGTTPDARYFHSVLSEMRCHHVTDVVMESSSHGLSQHRTAPILFHTAAFTNLTGDHLNYHGTMERYFQAKCILFREMLLPEAACVINIDDIYGKRLFKDLSKNSSIRLLPFSISGEDAFCSLRKAEYTSNDTTIYLKWDGCDERITIPLCGIFNMANTITAMLMAFGAGISLPLIYESIASLPQVPGRLQRFRLSSGAIAFVDYAHTDDALERALLSLRSILKPDGKIVTVFGCGGDRDKTKRPRMGAIAEKLSDYVFVTSDNPRTEDPMSIIADILKGMSLNSKRHFVQKDRETAIRAAASLVKNGDFLLVAGKGHEDYQEICHNRLHFNDMEILKSI